MRLGEESEERLDWVYVGANRSAVEKNGVTQQSVRAASCRLYWFLQRDVGLCGS